MKTIVCQVFKDTFICNLTKAGIIAKNQNNSEYFKSFYAVILTRLDLRPLSNNDLKSA